MNCTFTPRRGLRNGLGHLNTPKNEFKEIGKIREEIDEKKAEKQALN